MLCRFSEKNFQSICDLLGSTDADLMHILNTYGYPPMWTRPNSFETLIHIILEQQVSLASARSALEMLRARITDITAENLLALSDEELKSCYFSRQKTIYARHLAKAILDGTISLAGLEDIPDEEVYSSLSQLKGIGRWTTDVYLMFVLHRADIFPIGDLAAVNALKQLKKLPSTASRDEVLSHANNWKPNRTVATMLLWHYYLSIRNK